MFGTQGAFRVQVYINVPDEAPSREEGLLFGGVRNVQFQDSTLLF